MLFNSEIDLEMNTICELLLVDRSTLFGSAFLGDVYLHDYCLLISCCFLCLFSFAFAIPPGTLRILF